MPRSEDGPLREVLQGVLYGLAFFVATTALAYLAVAGVAPRAPALLQLVSLVGLVVIYANVSFLYLWRHGRVPSWPAALAFGLAASCFSLWSLVLETMTLVSVGLAGRLWAPLAVQVATTLAGLAVVTLAWKGLTALLARLLPGLVDHDLAETFR